MRNQRPFSTLALALAAGLAAAVPANAQDGGETEAQGLRPSLYDPAYGGEPVVLEEAPPDPAPPPAAGEDPYAPTGIRAGAFILFPELDARVGHSDNVFYSTAAPTSGTYLRLRPKLEARSDWIRHELRGEFSADYQSYPDDSGDETTGLDALVAGRLDVRSDTVATGELRYTLTPDSRGDPNVPATVVTPPDTETLYGSAGLSHTISRVTLGLTGSVSDLDYEDAVLIGGGILDNSDRSYVEKRGALRASYAMTPDTALFAEAGINERRYDRSIDDNGVLRGSKGWDVLAGLEFAPEGLVSGEVGVGYQQQRPDDPALPDIDGVAFRGALEWRPTGLTTVSFEGSITPEESVLEPGASGARVYAAEVTVAHALRRDLILSGGVGWARYDYVGAFREDTYLDATLGLEYRASRELAFVIEASHLRFESNVQGSDYEENRIEAGVKVRR